MNWNSVSSENATSIGQLHPRLTPGEDGLHEDLQDSELLIIIDPRALDRECLAQSIHAQKTSIDVESFGSAEEWRRARGKLPPASAILLSIGGKRISDQSVADELKKLAGEAEAVPIIVLSDTDQLSQIIKALALGASGFIPSSVGIDVCIEAIRLAIAGGVFVPASSVLGMHDAVEAGMGVAPRMAGLFTNRQAEVAEALRRGKANKIIAYELNLRESTVKVHIRNIMKKLKATNRTEVAFKINDLFPAD